jgi:hypothetical protein
MTDITKTPLKYPSEDEYLVRRLGSAVLVMWDGLEPATRAQIQAEAALVWDREYGVPQLDQKLGAFIRKFRSRIS